MIGPSLKELSIDALRRRHGSKWSTYPDDVLAAWVAEMDFPIAEPIRRVLAEMVENSDVGYPTLTDRPLRELRELFAARMAQRTGWQVEPARIDALTDVVQGIFAALQIFADEGEGVIVQPPVYPPFLQTVKDARRRLLENPLQQDASGAYHVDFDHLRRVIDKRTRILLLCNPHNPTGRVFTREELTALGEIAETNDLTIICDEIHADIIYPEHTHIPIASLSPEIGARTITLTSATKSFSIPGLRFAVVAFGSEQLQKRFAQSPSTLRGGVSAFGLQGTMAAWREGQPWLDAVLAHLEDSRDRVLRFAQRYLPGGLHPVPQATYLAWLDCRKLPIAGNPYQFFLDKARVALGNGAAFGHGGDGFVRFNFATSQNILTQIFHRMAAALYDIGIE